MQRKMIERVEVENFRGVKKATLAEISRINLFVGRSGKSSILEAIYIAMDPVGLCNVIERHNLVDIGAIFYDDRSMAKIKVEFNDGTSRIVEVRRISQEPSEKEVLEVRMDGKVKTVAVQIGRDGRVAVAGCSSEGISDVSFITYSMANIPGVAESMYSALVNRGGLGAKSAVVEDLKAEYEELKDIEVLVMRNVPMLYFVFKDRSIPYYVAGDGLRYALLILMSLFAREGGTIIIEEPETHMHPNLIEIVADAIVKAYRDKGNQLFISTHSLDLLYHLPLIAKGKLGNGELKVYHVYNKGGVVEAEVYSLNEAVEAVADLELDIRR